MIAERDRPPQLRSRRAGDDGERDLRPDTADGEQLDEELALGGVGEPVQLERVLAHVEVGLDGTSPPASARLSTEGVAATR